MKWVAGAGGGGRGLEVRKKREGRGSCWGLGYREEGDREPCGTCSVRRAEGLRGLMGRAEHRGPELGSFQRIGRRNNGARGDSGVSVCAGLDLGNYVRDRKG